VVVRSKAKFRTGNPIDIGGHLIRLYDLTVNLPWKTKLVVELGVRGGNSTVALLAAVNDSGGYLFSVDIRDCSKVFVGEPNWAFTLGNDLDVVKSWIWPIHHLFIDTSHKFEHTLNELQEWGKFLVQGGIISLHDTVSAPGVARAIEHYLRANPERFSYENFVECNGLGVLTKCGE